MKRQVRNNVFETNSSSVHAICISKEKVDMSKFNDTYVCFDNGEFGWEIRQYDGLYDKASYLYQAIQICSEPEYSYPFNGNDDEEEKWEQEKKKVVENNCMKIKEILSKYGVSCEFEQDGYGYIDRGHILDEFVNRCLNDEDYLLQYLFGDSYILTGNDNEDYYDFMELFAGSNKVPIDKEKYEIYKKTN